MIEAGIMPNDLESVRRQLVCKNGDVIVAFVDGEATVKYFRQRKNKVSLEPANKGYKPILIDKDTFSVIGKVISVVRRYV